METFVQHLTAALGWSIVHSLWQGALLYSLLCLIYSLWPETKAKYRYSLAYAAQILLLTLFFSTLFFYCWKLFPSSTTLTKDLTLFSPAEFFTTPVNKWAILERMLPWFSSIYILGLLLQLIFFGNSFSKLRQLRRSGLSEAPIEWLLAFQELRHKLSISKEVILQLSDKVATPLTIGYFKPLILFPVAYAAQMDIRQVESILLHELAHIKRNDYLLNLIKVCIETILFFNPFVWLLSKHIDTEREYACDDMVVEQILSPIIYAQALLAIEEQKHISSNPYAMSINGKQHHLLHRIKRITKMEKNYINVKQHLIAIAISTLALGALAWTAPTETKTEERDTKNTVIIQNKNRILYSEPLIAEEAALPLLTLQTDTTKKKSQVVIINRDTVLTLDEQSLSPEIQHIQAYYNSPEWKEHIAKIEENAKKVGEYFNSPEWKGHIDKIEANAKKVEEYYNSPEWKNQIAKIEENAKKVEEYYNSLEWKNQIAKIEANAKKVEEYYNSAEWKEQLAKIEADARKIGEYYNSVEWKQKVAEIEENARKAVEKAKERDNRTH